MPTEPPTDYDPRRHWLHRLLTHPLSPLVFILVVFLAMLAAAA